MRRTGIGAAGVPVTGIGLGTAQLGDLFEPLDQATATAIVDTAWECGIRFFDTAPHYGLGLAEERLGVALRERPREEYTLSTKVGRLIVELDGGRARTWDFSAEGVRVSLDSSRRRLGIDRVDIALVHDPEDHLDVALDAAYPELDRMRSAGVVGAIGVGSKHLPSLVRFVRETDIDVVMLAGRLTMLDFSALAELVPLCERRGVRILNAGVFNSGILATPAPAPGGRFDYEVAPDAVVGRARELATLGTRFGYTLPEAAIAFARHPSSVAALVLGAESVAQVRANVRAAEVRGDAEGLWWAVTGGAPVAPEAPREEEIG